jgi:hypothetical protein
MEWHVRCSRVQINGLAPKLRPLPGPLPKTKITGKGKVPFVRLHHWPNKTNKKKKKLGRGRSMIPCM